MIDVSSLDALYINVILTCSKNIYAFVVTFVKNIYAFVVTFVATGGRSLNLGL